MSDPNNTNPEDHSLEDRPDFHVNTGEFFSSIPVLKKDKKKRDDFSFEKFDDKEAEEQIHQNVEDNAGASGLESYTQLLTEEHDEETDADKANAITQDIITQNKEKWAKKAKQRKKKGGGAGIIIAIVSIIILLGGGAGAYFFLFSGSKPSKDKSPEPPAVEESKPANLAKIPLPKPDKATEKAEKQVKKVKPAKTSKPKQKTVIAQKDSRKQLLEDIEEEIDTLKEVIDEEKDKDIKEEVLIFLKNYHQELQPYLTIYDYMCSKDKKELADSIFSEWQKKKSLSANANYMKAKIIGLKPEAIPFLEKAIDVNLKLVPAYLDLAAIYEQKNDFREASRIYRKLLKRFPQNKEATSNYLALMAKRQELESGILQIKTLLKEQKEPKANIAAALIPYAQKLHDSKLADAFLDDLKDSQNHYTAFQVNTIKNKAIYGELTEDDFLGGFYPKEVRPYHMIFLLSQKRHDDVLLIQTPADEEPDFWKVFIAWEKDDDDWKDMAKAALKKFQDQPNNVFSIISKVWLKKLKPSVARKQLEKLPESDQPLLLFLLAEHYRKKKKKIKASVLYRKALKAKYSPYRSLIKSYSSKY